MAGGDGDGPGDVAGLGAGQDAARDFQGAGDGAGRGVLQDQLSEFAGSQFEGDEQTHRHAEVFELQVWPAVWDGGQDMERAAAAVGEHGVEGHDEGAMGAEEVEVDPEAVGSDFFGQRAEGAGESGAVEQVVGGAGVAQVGEGGGGFELGPRPDQIAIGSRVGEAPLALTEPQALFDAFGGNALGQVEQEAGEDLAGDGFGSGEGEEGFSAEVGLQAASEFGQDAPVGRVDRPVENGGGGGEGLERFDGSQDVEGVVFAVDGFIGPAAFDDAGGITSFADDGGEQEIADVLDEISVVLQNGRIAGVEVEVKDLHDDGAVVEFLDVGIFAGVVVVEGFAAVVHEPGETGAGLAELAGQLVAVDEAVGLGEAVGGEQGLVREDGVPTVGHAAGPQQRVVAQGDQAGSRVLMGADQVEAQFVEVFEPGIGQREGGL